MYAGKMPINADLYLRVFIHSHIYSYFSDTVSNSDCMTTRNANKNGCYAEVQSLYFLFDLFTVSTVANNQYIYNLTEV
jgi:hypothetical protein